MHDAPVAAVTSSPKVVATVAAPEMFTAKERELLRRKLGMRFGQYPSLAEGLFLRSWRVGPLQGQPKLPPAVQSMLSRGLVEIGPGRIGYRACFTAAGLAALRQFLQRRHVLEPGSLAHLRQELGLNVLAD